MGQPVTRHIATHLHVFEHAVQTGDLIREGGRVDGHTFELREAWRYRPQGPKRRYGGEALGVGDRVERTWDCSKPGFQRTLGLDVFEHQETFAKPTQDSMWVADRLSWHQGRSHAERRYTVTAEGSKKNQRITAEMAPWQVKMDGLRGGLCLVRGQVERTMRSQLPTQVDAPLLQFMSQLRPPSPRGALSSPVAAEALMAHARRAHSALVTLRD